MGRPHLTISEVNINNLFNADLSVEASFTGEPLSYAEGLISRIGQSDEFQLSRLLLISAASGRGLELAQEAECLILDGELREHLGQSQMLSGSLEIATANSSWKIPFFLARSKAGCFITSCIHQDDLRQLGDHWLGAEELSRICQKVFWTEGMQWLSFGCEDTDGSFDPEYTIFVLLSTKLSKYCLGIDEQEPLLLWRWNHLITPALKRLSLTQSYPPLELKSARTEQLNVPLPRPENSQVAGCNHDYQRGRNGRRRRSRE